MGTKTTFLLSQIEKLPWDLGKANACGGEVRPAVVATALSSETGKPIREDGKPLPFRHGEMSLCCHQVVEIDHVSRQNREVGGSPTQSRYCNWDAPHLCSEMAPLGSDEHCIDSEPFLNVRS